MRLSPPSISFLQYVSAEEPAPFELWSFLLSGVLLGAHSGHLNTLLCPWYFLKIDSQTQRSDQIRLDSFSKTNGGSVLFFLETCCVVVLLFFDVSSH